MLRNHIREYSLAYQLLLILGGTVVLVGGFIWAVKKMQGTRETAYEERTFTAEELAAAEHKPAERIFPQPVGNERYNLSKVLRFALEAQGGREALEGILTLRRRGTIELFDEETVQPPMRAIIIYRKPDMLRYSYQFEDRSFIAAFDGSNAWRQASTKNATLPPEELSPKDFQYLKQDIVTIRPLSTTLSDLPRLSLLEGGEVGFSDSHYRVQYKLDWMTEVLFFNKKNFLCERRDILLQTTEGNITQIRLDNEDFRYVRKLVFPYFVRVWVDGKIRNELTLDSIELNIGILPLVFSMPED